MRYLHRISTTMALLLLILASACGGAPAPEANTGSESSEPVLAEFKVEDFTNPTNINNHWLPLKPGRQWVYEGTTTEDGETTPHRIEFAVTDLTKEIAGVQTVVAWVADYSNDELVEAQIVFYAQDNAGNVWYLGEYPEEYENGEFVDAPAWIAGLEDAAPGIKMRPEPRLETPSYFQGWAPSVDWTDYGQVDKFDQQTCVPFNCYGSVLVIAESSLDEPNAFQLKYYARNVGNVRVGWRGEDATQETLGLVDVRQLDLWALAEVREKALALEKHAYEISKDVYAHTSPAVRMAGAEAAAGSESPEQLFEKIELPNFDPNNFDQSTNIDNKWLPLQPGTRLIYEGLTVDEGESIPHRLVFTVTDLTKEIESVNSVVAWIVDYEDGDLVEAEIAFYAQDNDGNVWFLGEYPEEYEEGEIVAAPAWIAGQEYARAGIQMKAAPQPETPGYFQGWGPAVGWTDYGQVDEIGLEFCVPEDCYEDVLAIAESSLNEAGAFQLKYYAPGVGNVGVGWRGSDETQEELELIDIVQLGPDALARAREEALKMEERAYEINKDVYAYTSPVESP